MKVSIICYQNKFQGNGGFIMKNIFFTILLLLHFIISIKAESVDNFLTASRNIALGNSGASFYSGLGSTIYNPALLIFNKRPIMTLEYYYDKRIDNKNINLGYLFNYLNKIAVSINLIYYNSEDFVVYDEQGRVYNRVSYLYHILHSSLSTKISESMSIGMNIKFNNGWYHDETSNSISLDIGGGYYPLKYNGNLKLGINFQNLLSTKMQLNNIEFEEPFNVKFGVSYFVPLRKYSFLFIGEMNSDNTLFPLYSFGMEFTFFKIFKFQLGYNEKNIISTGFNINYFKYSLNYSIEYQNLFNKHKISITYFFPKNISERRKERLYANGIRYYNDFNFKKSYKIFSNLYYIDPYYKDTTYYYELLKEKMLKEEEKINKRLKIADKMYREANSLYKEKKYSMAVNKLFECLRQNPRHREAKELLTQIRKIQKRIINKEKAKVRIKEGDYYYLMKKYPAALVEYQTALQLEPDNEKLKDKIQKAKEGLNKIDSKSLSMKLYKEGKKLSQAGNYSKAISKWEEALTANPEFTQIKLEIENAKEKLKELEEEIVMDKVVEDKIKNLFKIANYKISQKDYSGALFKVEDILSIEPDNKKAISLKKQILNEIRIKEIKDKKEKKRLENKYLQEGIAKFKAGKLEEALYNFSQVISLNPEKGKSIRELSVVLRKMRNLETKGILKDSPIYKLTQIHYERGMKFFNNNNYEGAKVEWGRILSILPENLRIKEKVEYAEELAQKKKQKKLSKFHLKRARKFLKEGKRELAMLEAKRILAILPDNRAAKRIIQKCVKDNQKRKVIEEYLEKAKEFADDEKYQEAIRQLNVILTIDPENKIAKKRLNLYQENLAIIERENKIENYLEKANKYYINENYSDAEKFAKKVLEIDKDNDDARSLINKINDKKENKSFSVLENKKIIDLYNEGISYYLNEKYEKCLATMKKILLLKPDNVQALKFIEKARNKLKAKEEKKINKKKKVDKKLVWKYYLKGINYYASGDIDNAISEWKLALKLDPDNEKIKRSLNKAYAKKEMLNE